MSNLFCSDVLDTKLAATLAHAALQCLAAARGLGAQAKAVRFGALALFWLIGD